MLPPDLHIHTAYCEHATGTMEEMVQSAVAGGLSEIGFADHFPYPEGYDPPAPHCVIPSMEAFENYAADVRRLQSAHSGRIRILFGAEVDYLDTHPGIQAERLSRFGFDYVIGSVHIVRGVAIDYREETLAPHLGALGGVEGLWAAYWDDVRRMALEGWCHVLGHLDLPRKFCVSAAGGGRSDGAEAVLRLAAERGLAVELNTGGFARACDRTQYPSLPILKRAAELGVDIAFGSDAHAAGDAGRRFRDAADLALSLGWTKAATFRSGVKMHAALAA
jgi:histidinol-phosphatase (PHP family)